MGHIQRPAHIVSACGLSSMSSGTLMANSHGHVATDSTSYAIAGPTSRAP